VPACAAASRVAAAWGAGEDGVAAGVARGGTLGRVGGGACSARPQQLGPLETKRDGGPALRVVGRGGVGGGGEKSEAACEVRSAVRGWREREGRCPWACAEMQVEGGRYGRRERSSHLKRQHNNCGSSGVRSIEDVSAQAVRRSGLLKPGHSAASFIHRQTSGRMALLSHHALIESRWRAIVRFRAATARAASRGTGGSSGRE